MQDPWRVFNKMPSQDVVTSTAMILGHVQCGQGRMALELFQQMQQEGVQQDSVTFVGFLTACSSVVAFEEGWCVINRSFKVVWSWMPLWGIAWLTCMQNVGALRILQKFSTRCHLKMWSLGMPYLEDVP
jgi:pentatricopeptide repeat protein